MKSVIVKVLSSFIGILLISCSDEGTDPEVFTSVYCDSGFEKIGSECHCELPKRMFGDYGCKELEENDYVTELPEEMFFWGTSILSFQSFIDPDPVSNKNREFIFYGDTTIGYFGAIPAACEYFESELDSFYASYIPLVGYRESRHVFSTLSGQFTDSTHINVFMRIFRDSTYEQIDSVQLVYHK